MAFCLLHGKWHEPSSWDPLVRELEQLGHDCVVPPVPSHDPRAGHEARARPAIEALAGVVGPIVVVGHSLAAAIAPLVAEHAKASLLVYLCPAPAGPLAGVDVGAMPLREGFPFPTDREDGTSVWEADAAIAAMYPRLDPATARALADRLQPGASAPDPYPLDRNPDVRSALVAARYDEFFVPEWSHRAARAVLGTEAIEIDSGHFPMIETPAELARLLSVEATA